ncbi:MAG: TauD/TfdA family dioxygenase [Proteobacteria bacterium]|nr:TauD/TfdA family dioxygenase [Pseudomonadota bacterium]
MNAVAADPRVTIAAIDNQARRLVVHWGDGHVSRYPAIALRATCRCAHCGTYESAIRPLRLTDIPADIAIGSATLEPDGAVAIAWAGERHASRYEASWLRATCTSPAERSRRRWRPTLWGKEIEGRVPEADYAACKADEGARLAMLEVLRDHGFVLLRGVPQEAEATPEIAALAGPLRVTNYGSVYDLRYNPRALVYGDLNVALDPHTDEPYRQAPPSVTIFHFVTAATSGGESTLTDAFRIGAELRRRDPEAFARLARHRVTFQRRLQEQDKDFRMAAPLFSLDEEGEIAGFRLLDRAVGPLDLPEEEVEPYYAALRLLLEMLYDEANQVTIPVAGGEALFFNNQRVLHGRKAFDTDGRRFMRTCHVDIDEFNSTLPRVCERLGRSGADLVLPHGALV